MEKFSIHNVDKKSFTYDMDKHNFVYAKYRHILSIPHVEKLSMYHK